MKYVIAWAGVLIATLSLAATTDAGAPVSRASDGDVGLVVEIDKQTAQVVEPIGVTLTLTAPAGSKVTLPRPSGELGAFQVQRVETVPDVPDPMGAGGRIWRVQIVLDTLQSGTLSIPPLHVQYRLPGGSEFQTLSSEPIEIQIASLLEDRADPTDFRDIKTVVDIAVPVATSRAWIGWLSGAASLSLVVATVVWFASRRRKVISPCDWALSQISQLESTIDTQPSTADSVYGELTMIIDEFVELQYGDPAEPPSRGGSHDEPAPEARVPESLRPSWHDFMSLAEEVKFAQRSVSETEVRQSIADAKEWVRACADQVSLPTKEAA